ncbi:MAG: hypothetical protein E7166_00840 [Firmicutes bacterium]|nr:hypothetical protein [Bacillota bacterium]
MLEDKISSNSSLNGYYDTFNNCRESGFILKLYNSNYNLYIWACQCRNSDNLMIIIGNEEDSDLNNNFTDDAYKKAKYFKHDEYKEAVDYVYKQIKYMYKNDIVIQKHIKYDRYYSMDALKRICDDASNLHYENYKRMATFCDEEEGYCCDLIIKDGKFGFCYSKISNEDKDVWDLNFEEYIPDLSSDVALMLNMKQKLANFIDEQIEYEITMSAGINI